MVASERIRGASYGTADADIKLPDFSRRQLWIRFVLDKSVSLCIAAR